VSVPPRHVSYASQDATLDDFVSSAPPMQACLERARLAARTELPVLILGESGTGKTILARAIHNSSARAAGPFVSFNAAALSETLIDSQLFGHERGAFTGAHAHVKGKFELADCGTLFLDEVADLSAQGQSKILRAIEYGEFERLGSETLRQANVRVLSATHHRPTTLVKDRQFREDLLYRINAFTIVVPPLRARPQDLPVLVASEIARASRVQGKSIAGLDPAAVDRVFGYHWPGNLRELSRVLQAAVAITNDALIPVTALMFHSDLAPGAGEHAEIDTPIAPAGSLRLRDAVHAHIRFVLRHTRGNKRRAARELGIGRMTLERKLQEMASTPTDSRRGGGA
jgi:transcriptional regulator with PAS, ATPase and Fis domain